MTNDEISDDGVDVSLVRWMLGLVPRGRNERQKLLAAYVDSHPEEFFSHSMTEIVAPWHLVHDKEQVHLVEELRRELSADHALAGKSVRERLNRWDRLCTTPWSQL